MTNARAEPSGNGGGGGFHTVQAERDLESNWELDLGTKLEDYLLRICSGELPTEADGIVSINFAEGELLLRLTIHLRVFKLLGLFVLDCFVRILVGCSCSAASGFGSGV